MAPLGPKFDVASYFISGHNCETDIGNQTKHNYIQEAFAKNIAKIKEAWIRCTQDDFMDTCIVLTIHDKNASDQAFVWNDNNCNLCLQTFESICLCQQ